MQEELDDETNEFDVRKSLKAISLAVKSIAEGMKVQLEVLAAS